MIHEHEPEHKSKLGCCFHAVREQKNHLSAKFVENTKRGILFELTFKNLNFSFICWLIGIDSHAQKNERILEVTNMSFNWFF